jgi:hypothetical protein
MYRLHWQHRLGPSLGRLLHASLLVLVLLW